MTLNKCVFGESRVKFLGHIIDADGIRTDPDKMAAIKDMSPPTTVTEVRRFLGMANQLSKFSPNLADRTSQPHGYGLKITRKLSRILKKNSVQIGFYHFIIRIERHLFPSLASEAT